MSNLKIHGHEAFAITPSDLIDFEQPVAGVFTGSGGDISVVAPNGVATLYRNVPASEVLHFGNITRVNATGTTAKHLAGLLPIPWVEG